MDTYDTLVLTGASQKGFVILGALQYAIDNYLIKDVTTYIGTSSGAIISYLLIIGYTPIEMVVYLCTNKVFEQLQNINIMDMFQGKGAISFQSIHEHLEKMTISKIGYLPTLQNLLEKYNKTLICITHNITDNKTEYLSPDNYPTLPCITALRMSSNIPGIFEKFKYGHAFYIDGGVSDNFGIQLGDILGTKVLGLSLSSKISDNTVSDEDNDKGTLEYIYKVMMIPIDCATSYKIEQASEKCNVINLKSPHKKFFDFDIKSQEKMDMFVIGYDQMSKKYNT
jgi:predicted acylesterase/phospholipase RssA